MPPVPAHYDWRSAPFQCQAAYGLPDLAGHAGIQGLTHDAADVIGAKDFADQLDRLRLFTPGTLLCSNS